ncbi:MAG: S-layer homology domain-containing protein, partial [Bacillota bacterium]
MRRCLAAVVTIIMALVLALPVMANPFADVPETHWAYEAVKRLAASGLVQGFPDGIFKGAEEMTRYQMAIVVARVLSDLDSQIREAVEISKAAAGESPAARAPVEKIIERVIMEKPVIERIIEQHIVEKEGSIDRAILDARVAEIITIIDALKTEFTQELNVLGVRVTALEEQLALANAKLDDVNRLTSEINARLAQTASKLEGHIAGHERVRISGDSKVSFEDVDITAATNAVTPWVDPFDPGRVAGDPDYVYQPTSKFNHDLNLKLTANIANGVVAEAGLATVRNIFGSKDSWDSSEFRLKENGLYLDVVAPGVLRHMRVGHVAEPVGAFSSLTLQSHKLRDDDVPRYEGVLTEMVYGRFSGTGLFWRLQEPVSGDGQAKYAQYAVAVDTKLSLTDNVIIGATYVAAFDDEKSLENGPASPVKDTVAGLNARVALAPGWAASAEFARNIKEDAQYTATEMSLDGRIGLLRLGTAYTRIDDGYHPYFV